MSVAAANGVATFSTVPVHPGSNCTLTASDGTLTPATSAISYTFHALASFNTYPIGYSTLNGAVVDANGNIFGTSMSGGSTGAGTVFEIANGSGVLANLATFNGANGVGPGYIMLDSAGDIYGLTQGGNPAPNNEGSVFRIAHGTTNITTIASFSSTTGNKSSAQ